MKLLAPVLSLLLIFSLRPVLAAPEVPVTRRWGELYGQVAREVDGGSWVRLGLEAKSGRPGSPVLVYCLVEGDWIRERQSPRPGPEDSERERDAGAAKLGPLSVAPVGPRLRRFKPAKRMRRLRRYPQGATRVLFAAALKVPADLSQRYELRRGEQVVATFALSAKGGEPAPWFVAGLPQAPAQALTQPKALGPLLLEPPGRPGRPPNLVVRFERGTPRWPGLLPLLSESSRAFIPLQRGLPRAIPQAQTLGVRVLERGELELTHEDGIGALAGRLLVRLWIEGVPVSLRPRFARAGASDQDLRKLERRVHVKLRLDPAFLDPTLLGPKAAVRVEAQLLYCPSGFVPVGPHERLRLADEEGRPALSRRFLLRP